VAVKRLMKCGGTCHRHVEDDATTRALASNFLHRLSQRIEQLLFQVSGEVGSLTRSCRSVQSRKSTCT